MSIDKHQRLEFIQKRQIMVSSPHIRFILSSRTPPISTPGVACNFAQKSYSLRGNKTPILYGMIVGAKEQQPKDEFPGSVMLCAIERYSQGPYLGNFPGNHIIFPDDIKENSEVFMLPFECDIVDVLNIRPIPSTLFVHVSWNGFVSNVISLKLKK
jgi:hypothetical protein